MDNRIAWACADKLNKEDAWGDWRQIQPELLFVMQKIAEVIPGSIKIHSAYKETSNHSGLMHKGRGVEFHAIGCSILEANKEIIKMMRRTGLIELCGIGIYPDWVNPGFKIDIRGKRAAWAKAQEQYVSYSEGIDYIGNKNAIR